MIDIQVIPHSDQRYPTCGDWWWDAQGDWHIRVSRMCNWRFEFLVALHELVEMALCRHEGITEGEATSFDKDFEETRERGDVSEPGDSPLAPYYVQHQIASMIERMLARLIGVDWNEYSEVVNEL